MKITKLIEALIISAVNSSQSFVLIGINRCYHTFNITVLITSLVDHIVRTKNSFFTETNKLLQIASNFLYFPSKCY